MYLIKTVYKTDYSQDRIIYLGQDVNKIKFVDSVNYNELEDFINTYSICIFNEKSFRKKLSKVPNKMIIDGMVFTLISKEFIRFKYTKEGLMEEVINV